MTTASLPPQARPISRETLIELLSSQGQCHENLGSGVREALVCLNDARHYYDLPAVLAEPLDRFANHLREAIGALEEAREVLH